MKHFILFILILGTVTPLKATFIDTNLCSLSWWQSNKNIQDELQSVLVQESFHPNQSCDEKQNTPLLLAVRAGVHLQQIITLVTQGANVSMKNTDGENAIYLASQYNTQDVYQYLTHEAIQTREFQTSLLHQALVSLVEDEASQWNTENATFNRYFHNTRRRRSRRNQRAIGVYVAFNAGTILDNIFNQDHTPVLEGETQRSESTSTLALTSGIMLGYAFSPVGRNIPLRFRLESEYGYRKMLDRTTSTDEQRDDYFHSQFTHQSFFHFDARHYFMNFYTDFYQLVGNLTPYLGVGVGVSHPNIQSSWFSRDEDIYIPNTNVSFGETTLEDDHSLGMQVLLGVDHALTRRITLGLKARYMKLYEDFMLSTYWKDISSGASMIHDHKVEDLDFYDLTAQLSIFFGR